jgi:hypothetical protein
MRPPVLLLLCCLGAGGGSAAFAADPPVTKIPPVTPVTAPASPAPAIGEETSLEALTGPQRFAWPARFTCSFDEDGASGRSLTLVESSFAALNAKLSALDVLAEDCRGGFVIESLEPQPGKLDRIIAHPGAGN